MLLQESSECCEDAILTMKKGLATYLGITYERSKNIELRNLQVPFELVMDRCDGTKAPLEKQVMKHI
ncbi:hypothetical protein P4G85_15720 [Bacillus cereus]|uniref:Uncharacterized protein n=2 Tax=Bacillus cereus group TaxID=86661 RepID=A0A9W5L1A9_BACCE|nr:hypothetical protein [Bacillus cereus]EEM44508.1 hypothetical protein bthur0005_57190 [Bacillus thuringiensis serovar pakistani str. T13001]ALZ60416.1 hypothetical protein FORC13_1355 [Bacillus cereus]EJR74482.1 hypothetical protein IK5_01741 [Bacillus cereus VD154]MEB8749767.1 hypothetical protein [Bacillus cereus]TFZ14439.1 hypothetical protein C6Y54_02160 [Bacillus cereus]